MFQLFQVKKHFVFIKKAFVFFVVLSMIFPAPMAFALEEELLEIIEEQAAPEVVAPDPTLEEPTPIEAAEEPVATDPTLDPILNPTLEEPREVGEEPILEPTDPIEPTPTSEVIETDPIIPEPAIVLPALDLTLKENTESHNSRVELELADFHIPGYLDGATITDRDAMENIFLLDLNAETQEVKDGLIKEYTNLETTPEVSIDPPTSEPQNELTQGTEVQPIEEPATNTEPEVAPLPPEVVIETPVVEVSATEEVLEVIESGESEINPIDPIEIPPPAPSEIQILQNIIEENFNQELPTKVETFVITLTKGGETITLSAEDYYFKSGSIDLVIEPKQRVLVQSIQWRTSRPV